MERAQRQAPLIVAMKRHPGTGKTTLAEAIAAALRCPLIDKDDIRDATLSLSSTAPSATLNHLSYEALWRLTSTQLRLGLSVVVDSPSPAALTSPASSTSPPLLKPVSLSSSVARLIKPSGAADWSGGALLAMGPAGISPPRGKIWSVCWTGMMDARSMMWVRSPSWSWIPVAQMRLMGFYPLCCGSLNPTVDLINRVD